ncbi:MAG: substrate-binding domain-containing protein [Campylobacteraceae bacterium]|jgi:molybdate transport system substrate-binding protein|nr:substrate-binding domain-containing protein [Campylobacteraceae bacterium]
MDSLKNNRPFGLWKKLTLGISMLFLSVSTVSAGATCTNKPNPDITIAVASNMWEPAQDLANIYNVSNNIIIEVCHNSTGNLVNDINTGNSGYSLFLAANASAPYSVTNYTVNGTDTIHNYTTGIPVLWSKNVSLVDFDSTGNTNGSITLTALILGVNEVVIADPALAPYGLAAVDIMKTVTNQWSAVTNGTNSTSANTSNGSYLITKNNIDSTYTYINATESAVGYVALSQVCRNSIITSGYGYKDYPSTYDIPQSGVLINQNPTENSIAAAFWDWLLLPRLPVGGNAQYVLQTTYCYGPPQ